MWTLLFSFLLNNIPSPVYPFLPELLAFPTEAVLFPILLQLFISFPFLLSPSPSCSFTFWRWSRAGVRGQVRRGRHLISCLSINHMVLSPQFSSDPSASLSANPSNPTHTCTDKWCSENCAHPVSFIKLTVGWLDCVQHRHRGF